MADEALFSSVHIPIGNIHRILGELPVEEAAQKYEDVLRHFFGSGSPPRFNLVLLGLGSDGHTASLFPGTPAVKEKKSWVAGVRHDVPPPPLVDRVTLTLPVLNAAAYVLFLVSGKEKAERLAQVLYGPIQPNLLPAQAVKPVNGTVTWLADQAAAAKLPPQHYK
jgi:6-phosphogluconolactonase